MEGAKRFHHDLRNALGTIVLNARLLALVSRDPANAACVDRILRAAQQAEDLCRSHELLALERADAPPEDAAAS